MLKKEIQVSGEVVPTQITGESRYGGWDARNRISGRAVRIKGAARIRYEMETCEPYGPTGRTWREVRRPLLHAGMSSVDRSGA